MKQLSKLKNAFLVLLVTALAGCTLNIPPADDSVVSSVSLPLPAGVNFKPHFPTGKFNATTHSLETCGALKSIAPSTTTNNLITAYLNQIKHKAPQEKPRGNKSKSNTSSGLSERIQNTLSRGHFIIGINVNDFPFAFRKPNTGEIYGFDADLALALNHDVFGSTSQPEFRSVPFDKINDQLNDNSIDFAINSLGITCDRAKNIGFTVPFFTAGMGLVSRGAQPSRLDTIGGSKVCILQDDLQLSQLHKYAPQAQAITVRNWTDCYVLLSENLVDTIFTPDPVSENLVNEDSELKKYQGLIPKAVYYGVEVAKDNTVLIQYLNYHLTKLINEGVWHDLFQQNNFEFLPDADSYPPSPEYKKP